MKLLDQFVFDTTRTINLLALTIVAGIVGLATYLIMTHLLKVEEIQLFYKLLGKMKISKNNIEAEAVDLTATEQKTV